jgi:hypothetical protein
VQPPRRSPMIAGGPASGHEEFPVGGNNPMTTGSDGEGARTRGLRDHLSCPSQPATAAPPVNPVASRLRSAGPLGPSTAVGAAVAFLSPARGYRQRQAGRRPGSVSAYWDF